jgi:PTH1 family peptidyl-tRNA hydrolase
MWLVVGLGNPGPKYARNRHNVGFRAVEVLASRHGLGELRSGGKLGGATATGVITTPRGRVKVVLLEPMEFMNLSGFAVRRAATFYGVDLDHTVVLHDEIDLDFGVLRVKTGGGHGGHNGLRSIIEQCGGNGFARIRIGVGKPGPQPGTADGGAAQGQGRRQGRGRLGPGRLPDGARRAGRRAPGARGRRGPGRGRAGRRSCHE